MENRRNGGFSLPALFMAVNSAVLTASGWASLSRGITTWASPVADYLALYQNAMARIVAPVATLFQSEMAYWVPDAAALWAGFGMGMSVLVLSVFAYEPEDGHGRAGPMVWLLATLIAPIAFVVITLASIKEGLSRAVLSLVIATAIAIGPFGLLFAVNTQMG